MEPKIPASPKHFARQLGDIDGPGRKNIFPPGQNVFHYVAYRTKVFNEVANGRTVLSKFTAMIYLYIQLVTLLTSHVLIGRVFLQGMEQEYRII